MNSLVKRSVSLFDTFRNRKLVGIAVRQRACIEVFLTTLCLCLAHGLFAQEIKSIRFASTDTLWLDSTSLQPGSLQLLGPKGLPVPDSLYSFNALEGWLIPSEELVKSGGEYTMSYRKLAFDLKQPYYHKSSDLIMPGTVPPNFNPGYENHNSGFEPFDGLSRNGSISRGITVGNNQDLVLTSGLNLQLSGEIADQTFLRASITDNNLPVQSGGYTQVLQEFDRAYIELENKNYGKITAGDFNLVNTNYYFMPFSKKLSGADIQTASLGSEGSMTQAGLTGALSRGRFARNVFFGEDGIQGPYKLAGNSNEQFIVIISGSERVYMDGVQLTRGENNDYVIDYNAAEITFTALRQVTNVKRIIVEFQYTDQSYNRSLVMATAEQQLGNSTIKAGYYIEQDAKNQGVQQNLSPEEIDYMSQIGNDPDKALIPAWEEVGYTEGELRYAMIDTLGYDSVFVYSTDPAVAVFTVSFTYLGPNQGDYRISNAGLNQRVFEWVEPVNGIPQGSYAPVKRLVTPQKLEIVNLGFNHKWNERSDIEIDWAMSDRDLNTFSEVDNENNQGMALNFGFKYDLPRANGNWKVLARGEVVGERFRTIERFRSVEFNRDWNLTDSIPPATQQFYRLGAHYFSKKSWDLGYERQHFLNGESYQTSRNLLTGSANTEKTTATLTASALTGDILNDRATFVRHISYLKKIYGPLKVGFRGETEFNVRKDQTTDSLRPGGYDFQQWEVFAGNSDTTSSSVELKYLYRYDKKEHEGNMRLETRAQNWELRSTVYRTTTGRLNLQGVYRILESYVDSLMPQDQTVTGRVQWSQRFWNNSLTLNTFYEAGSGREARREFTYLEVPAGQGVYAWIDYNENGLQELDEFEIALFPDQARYIRVFTQGNEYYSIYQNRFSQMVLFNPAALITGEGSFRNLIKKLSWQGTFQTDRRTERTDVLRGLNPFLGFTIDSSLIGYNDNFRNSFFFNRSENKYGGDFTTTKLVSRNFLSYGYENRSLQEQIINARWEFIPEWQWTGQHIIREKDNNSESFPERSYALQEWLSEHKISYQAVRGKATFGGRMEEKLNIGEGGEQLKAISAIGEYQTALWQKGLFSLQMQWIQNDFEGLENTPVAYEMLQGLSAGTNITWTANLQLSLLNNLQLTLFYSGRDTQKNRAVHNGTVQLKAFF
jgi:hypothetical protein